MWADLRGHAVDIGYADGLAGTGDSETDDKGRGQEKVQFIRRDGTVISEETFQIATQEMRCRRACLRWL